MSDLTPWTKFDRWFIAPLAHLAKMKDGDGAFFALSVYLTLYERYAKSELKRTGIAGNPTNFFDFGHRDLGMELFDFKIFWGMYRDGLQHQCQPKIFESNGVKYSWKIGAEHGPKPQLVKESDRLTYCVLDPWKFCQTVVERYRSNPQILEVSESHPLGDIFE